MIQFRDLAFRSSAIGLIAVVLSASVARADGGTASPGAGSSDQWKDVHELEEGAIDLFVNQQSVGVGAFQNSAGSEGASGLIELNLGRAGFVGDTTNYSYEDHIFTLIDFRGEGALRFEVDRQGGTQRLGAEATAVSLLNYQGISFPSVDENGDGRYSRAEDPNATFAASILTFGAAYRQSQALDYEQSGLALRLFDVSSHASFALSGGALVDFCASFRPLEWLVGGQQSGQRNRYRVSDTYRRCADEDGNEVTSMYECGELKGHQVPVGKPWTVSEERVSPSGLIEFCGGVTSANGKWNVRDKLMLETDYAALGREYGHRQLTNTVSLDRGPVSLWYETDIERQGEDKVVTHKAGVTLKRRKKK